MDRIDWELRNKIAAIAANEFRDITDDTLANDADALIQASVVHNQLDFVIAALGGEQNPTTLDLTPLSAHQVAELVANRDTFDHDGGQLDELETTLRLAFLHPDASVRGSAMNNLRHHAEDSAATEGISWG